MLSEQVDYKIMTAGEEKDGRSGSPLNYLDPESTQVTYSPLAKMNQMTPT